MTSRSPGNAHSAAAKRLKALVTVWYFPLIACLAGATIFSMSVWLFHWPINPHLIPAHPPALESRLPRFPPLTDDELIHEIINTPTRAVIHLISVLLLIAGALAIFFTRSFQKWPSMFAAVVAALQISVLAGLHAKVYFAVWWHALHTLHNPWQLAAAYCLAILTLYGTFTIIRWFVRTGLALLRFTKLVCLNLVDNW